MTNAELARKHREAAKIYRDQVDVYNGLGLMVPNDTVIDLANRFDDEAARLERLPPDEEGVARPVPSRR